MEENHQDKAGSQPTASEIKLWLPPSSPKDQEKLKQLQNNQMEDTIKQLRDRGYKVTEEYSNSGQLSKVSGEHPQRKTGWDWLQLIIQAIGAIVLPISIVIGVWQFTTQQQNDRMKSVDEQQQTTLQNYLSNMSDLLLKEKLREAKSEDAVTHVAEAQTLTALQNLNPARKGILVKFLHESNLIAKGKTIISLHGADLSGIDLQGAYYTLTDLHESDLSGANLRDAKLNYTDLFHAALNNTDLSGAHLQHAFLDGADLHGAILDGVDLSDAFLRGANLNGAYFGGVDLSGAVELTQQQLDQVYSCVGATLPKGLTCHR